MNEQIEQIKEKMIHPKATSLNMARVPIQTAEIFKKFANDEFVGDYGQCLRAILEDALEYRALKHVLLEKGEATLTIKVDKK